ncbi:ATP-dependent helicase [Candidatus Gracilibacteria bacterium]|nr:ATP-dependent helicase [Candidatus Gracilibacteria bacterium]
MLNQAQERVVRHEGGPLLVISGAGTGKTHVLTQRLLHLMNERKIAPESILALTFTEKATQEMADRIEAAKPYTASRMMIRTFHSFCDAILREFGLHIGLSSDYKLLQDADLLFFLKRHYHDFKLTYFATRSQPYRILTTLQGYFSRLQDEDITPEAYSDFAAGMATATSEEQEEAQKHTELAQAYGTYLQLLVENRYMDYAGLQYHTLRLLEKRSSVLASLQKRFAHIMVDEFQDTNYSQMKMVIALAKSHKNIMVVGDDDQSIYKWRGASLSNAQIFTKTFPGHKTEVLTQNYRSTQAILDATYAVIQNNNPNRLEISHAINKRLLAEDKDPGSVPEVHHFVNGSDERAFIIARAKHTVKMGNSVAILCRTNSLATQFIELLQNQDTPLVYSSYNAFFQSPGVKDIMGLLRFLSDPKDDIALFRVLSLSHWNIPQQDILLMLNESKKTHASLFDILKRSELAEIATTLESLIEKTRTLSVSEIIGTFFDTTSFVSQLEKKGEVEALQAVGTFSEKVGQFEETHEDKSVLAFVEYTKIIEDMGGQNEGISSSKEGNAAVHVITVHGSKGLEFDEVIVPSLVQNKFPGIRRSESLEIPAPLIQEPLPETDTHMEEERRLFYVACTRARASLLLTYSDKYESTRNYKVSPFATEMLTTSHATYHHHLASGPEGIQGRLFEEVEDSKTPHVQLSTLSYSQISTYETCPLKYQFRYLFRLPEAPSASLSFGISVHNALKDIFTEIKKNPSYLEIDLSPLIEELVEKNWIASGYASRMIQLEQKQTAKAAVVNYYNKMRDQLTIPHEIEVPFRFTLSGIKISGRIDRVDKLADGTYEIIDYKTGSPENYRVNSDMQLSLYALAAEKSLKIPISKLSLHFIETAEILSTTRNKKQLDKCEESITETAEEIKKGIFIPTPGFQCNSCDFRLICPARMVMLR